MSFWAPVLGGAILAVAGAGLLLWKQVALHHLTLYGPDESNGVRGDVKQLKDELKHSRHDLRNEMAVQVDALDDRLRKVEQR